ncbi:hypothetical protein ABLV98_11280 [Staphylococcus sp. 50Mo3-1]|uniref:hypothetical protein n=1 Tax=Staphylococcus sp. 50Mo3-2 TaxID=3135642 RepID=UPI0033F94AFD
MLETILQEIRDELKRSNDLKSKQLQDFTNTAEEPAGWTQLPAEEREEETPAKEEPKEEAPATAEAPDEATFKKAIAQIIKGGTPEQKSAVKQMIKDAGASKVSDVQADKRQSIIDAIEAM